jgi:hypothetical protein
MRHSSVRRAERSSTDDLIKDGDCAQLGRRLEHRHDLAVPDRGKRRRSRGFFFYEGSRGSASMRSAVALLNRPCSSNGRRVGLTGLDEQPRLAVGDVLAGKC